jgi:hypothetical protein
LVLGAAALCSPKFRPLRFTWLNRRRLASFLAGAFMTAGAVILATGMIYYLGVPAELVNAKRPARRAAIVGVNLETEQESAALICARQSGDGC